MKNKVVYPNPTFLQIDKYFESFPHLTNTCLCLQSFDRQAAGNGQQHEKCYIHPEYLNSMELRARGITKIL